MGGDDQTGLPGSRPPLLWDTPQGLWISMCISSVPSPLGTRLSPRVSGTVTNLRVRLPDKGFPPVHDAVPGPPHRQPAVHAVQLDDLVEQYPVGSQRPMSRASGVETRMSSQVRAAFRGGISLAFPQLEPAQDPGTAGAAYLRRLVDLFPPTEVRGSSLCPPGGYVEVYVQEEWHVPLGTGTAVAVSVRIPQDDNVRAAVEPGRKHNPPLSGARERCQSG